VGKDGAGILRFTVDREKAAQADELQLLGLDHARLSDEIFKWRNSDPSMLGISVKSNSDGLVMLSCWLVETRTAGGDRQLAVQVLAVKPDGTRIPAIEKQLDQYFTELPTEPGLSGDERAKIFSSVVEPSLQRELRHRGAANGEGSYSAELIGYIEIC